MCFCGVAVAIDTVLRSLRINKSLIKILRIDKSLLQNFSKCYSKYSDQNTEVVKFFPWKVAMPNFSDANDPV